MIINSKPGIKGMHMCPRCIYDFHSNFIITCTVGYFVYSIYPWLNKHPRVTVRKRIFLKPTHNLVLRFVFYLGKTKSIYIFSKIHFKVLILMCLNGTSSTFLFIYSVQIPTKICLDQW